MKQKMGRPKVAKAKLRGIMVNARLSPEENEEIQAAIATSSDNKSDWIRKALLLAVRRGKKSS
jgi:DNA replication protein DnaD